MSLCGRGMVPPALCWFSYRRCSDYPAVEQSVVLLAAGNATCLFGGVSIDITESFLTVESSLTWLMLSSALRSKTRGAGLWNELIWTLLAPSLAKAEYYMWFWLILLTIPVSACLLADVESCPWYRTS